MMLTKRQKEILDFIENFTKNNGYSPAYREIAKYFKLSSPATVHEHISTLEAKGALARNQGEARSVSLTADVQQFGQALRLPLVGLITAGAPIEAIEEKETIEVPTHLLASTGRNKTFVLKVQGDSMIEDGILDGDYVIVEKREHANNGEVVVALIDNQYATLKRFYREKKRVRLQPANRAMKPIFVDQVDIQGIVKGLMRKI